MRRGRNNFLIDNEFYCTKCGNKGIPIARKKGQEREAGHLKKLFCLKCQEETNHVECKPFSHYEHEDFLFEFENGNFTETGARKMGYGEFKHLMEFGPQEQESERKENDDNDKESVRPRRSIWEW
jgi:hypothetical protein